MEYRDGAPVKPTLAKEMKTTQKKDEANRRFKASEKETDKPEQVAAKTGEGFKEVNAGTTVPVTGDELKGIETAHKEVDPEVEADPYAEVKQDVERLKAQEDYNDRMRGKKREKYSDKSKLLAGLGMSEALPFHPPGFKSREDIR